MHAALTILVGLVKARFEGSLASKPMVCYISLVPCYQMQPCDVVFAIKGWWCAFCVSAMFVAYTALVAVMYVNSPTIVFAAAAVQYTQGGNPDSLGGSRLDLGVERLFPVACRVSWLQTWRAILIRSL